MQHRLCRTAILAADGSSGILQMILRKHVATHVLIWDGLSPGTFGGFLSNEATQHFNKHFSVRRSPFRACERAYFPSGRSHAQGRFF